MKLQSLNAARGDGEDLAAALQAHDPAALLFDLDGTLVDSTASNFRALQAAWRAQGHLLDPDWYAARTGLSVAALAGAWETAHGQTMDADAAIDSFISASVADAPDAVWFQDTLAVLGAYRGTRPIALVTNNFGPIVRALLQAKGLTNAPSVIATADLPGLAPKPAPDLYAFAIRALGTVPSRSVAIEDSDEGVNAARAAGLTAIDIRAFR